MLLINKNYIYCWIEENCRCNLKDFVIVLREFNFNYLNNLLIQFPRNLTFEKNVETPFSVMYFSTIKENNPERCSNFYLKPKEEIDRKLLITTNKRKQWHPYTTKYYLEISTNPSDVWWIQPIGIGKRTVKKMFTVDFHVCMKFWSSANFMPQDMEDDRNLQRCLTSKH